MTKSNLYKQCLLTRGESRQTSFIPAEYAKVYDILELKEHDRWENGWMVIEVFEPAITWRSLQTAAKQARETRKASDI